jgi:hypothetical protein
MDANHSSIEEIANEIKTSQYKEISNKNLADVKAAVEMIGQIAINPLQGLDNDTIIELEDEEAQKNKDKQVKFILTSASLLGALAAIGYMLRKYYL